MLPQGECRKENHSHLQGPLCILNTPIYIYVYILKTNLYKNDMFPITNGCSKDKTYRCSPFKNMHGKLIGMNWIFSNGLASRQISCFRCRIDEQYFTTHMFCVAVFPYVDDTEFTLRELFLLPRRVIF